MGQCTNSLETKDFIDPHCLAQLADDAAILADGVHLLGEKMGCLLEYSKDIYQVPNIPKTVFCHFSKLRLTEQKALWCILGVKNL